MRFNAFGVLLAVNAALVGALAFLWSDAKRVHWSEPEALRPMFDEVSLAATSEPVEISSYRETIERPLFSPNRRKAPSRQSEAEAEPPVDPFKDIRLVGVYGGEHGRGGLVVVSAGKLQRVAFGEKIGQWTVTGEDGHGASLVHSNGERRSLQLALVTTTPVTAGGSASRAEGLAPGEDGKAKEQESVPTPAGSAPHGAPGSAAAVRRSAIPESATPEQRARMEQRQRDRLERLNSRRAKRGLPPLTN